MELPLEYWIEHVTIRPLYVKFLFSTRITYSGIPGYVMIVLVVFGDVDYPGASGMMVYFWGI